jgi:prepilin-type N-terminal cleavage/methylation domain-containing protein
VRRKTTPIEGDDGFTLPELLLTMVIGLVAIFAVLYFVVASQQQNNDVFDRVGAVDETSQALKNVQNDLRTAYKITPMPASGTTASGTLGYQAVVSSGGTYSLHTFLLDCTVAGTTAGMYKCVRTDQTAGTSTIVLENLTSPVSSTFTVHAPGTVGLPRVDISVTHRVTGNGPTVKISSSVQPRNCQTTALVSGACSFP